MTEERDERLDEALSALRDEELSPGENADLSRRVDAEPALRERLEAFEEVDQALEGLASREVPADLGQRLRTRIERDRAVVRVRLRDPGSRSAVPRRRSRLRGAWGAGLAAAAAATLYVVLPATGPQGPDSGGDSLAAREVTSVAVVQSSTPSVDPVVPAPSGPTHPAGFENASEEEVAIAFHYETLADLDVIEELEMLELLAALDELGPRG